MVSGYLRFRVARFEGLAQGYAVHGFRALGLGFKVYSSTHSARLL